MSGPVEPSDGRAEKANHDPSGEYDADCPTTFTPDTMARFATSVAEGVDVGLTVGSGVWVGSGVAVGRAVGSVAVAWGVAVAGASDALPLGSLLGEGATLASTGVDAGVAFGVGEGVRVGLGVRDGSAVGSEMTRTESLPEASVPTTTASFRTGDCEIDLGRIVRSTWREFRSAISAQSGWRSTGQTSSTAATLYARRPSAEVPTHPTEPAPTAIGVGPGRVLALARATAGAVGCAGAVAGASSQPPDITVAPMTTAMTATPERTPSAGAVRPVVRWRDRPRCVRDSRSMAAAVRAQRSRGGWGVRSPIARRASRSDWYAFAT